MSSSDHSESWISRWWALVVIGLSILFIAVIYTITQQTLKG